MSDCKTCGQPVGCNSIDGFDLYSLQTELYPFILVCPPGLYCGDALEFRMSCCGSNLVLVFPQGAVPAEKERLVASAIAECSRSLAFCNPTTDDETEEPPTPGVVTRWYYNQPQTCNIACPDGSYFSNYIGAGIAAGITQSAANRVAYAYACSTALARRVCIRDFVFTACANTAFSEQVKASGGGLAKPPLTNTWSIDAGVLPTGLTIDADTGVISGTPTDFGDFVFTVKVVTPSGSSQTRDCSLTIIGIEAETLPDGVVGSDYSYPLTQSGFSDGVWTVTAGSLPDGLTLDSELGIISGTPTTEDSYSFTVTITNDEYSCSADFTMDVNAALEITTASPLTSATVGVAYSETLAASGGVPPYAGWAVISGQLPAGLTLNTSTGEISGTPTTAETQAFTVEVTDLYGDTATKPFSLTVAQSYPMQAWWTMEETGTSDRVDSINSVHLPLDYQGAAWGVSAAAGIVGNALQFTCTTPATNDGVTFQSGLNSALKLNGTGVSIVFWVKFAAFTTPNCTYFVRYYIAGFAGSLTATITTGGGGLIQAQSNLTTVTTASAAFTPVVGNWYMIHMWYDQVDGKVNISINNDPLKTYSSPAAAVYSGSTANGAIQVDCGAGATAGATNIDIRTDELSMTPEVLDSTTLATMYNSGAGNTWPLP